MSVIDQYQPVVFQNKKGFVVPSTLPVYAAQTKTKVTTTETAVDKAKPFSDAFYDKMTLSSENFVNFVAGKITDKTASLEELLSFSSFDSDDKYTDKVKQAADMHFISLVQYYMNDEVRNILGWSKPAPHARLLEIASSDKVVAWYKKYSLLYAHYLVSLQLKGAIKIKVLEADIKTMTSSKIYVKQTSAIFKFAFIERNPKITIYLKNAKKWTEDLKNYYLTNSKCLEEWMRSFQENYNFETFFAKFANVFSSTGHQTQANQILNIPKTMNCLDSIVSNIRNKLDVLDQSAKSSSEVINFFYSSQYAFFSSMTNLDGNAEYFKAMEKHVDDVLDRLSKLKESSLSGPQLDFYKLYKDVLLACGGMAGVRFQLTNAIKRTVNRIAPYTDITMGFENILKMPQMETENMKIFLQENAPDVVKKVPKGVNFFMSMWRGCQSISILYGIVNFDPKAGVLSNTQFIGDSLAIVLDTFTTIQKVDVAFTAPFASLAKGISNALKVFKPTQLVKLFSSSMKWFFTKSFNDFLNFRVCPALIVLSCIMNCIDIAKDIEEGKWGELACDVAALGLNIATVAVLVAGASWSGPVALVLGGVAILVLIIKLWISTPEKSPAQKFLESKFVLLAYKRLPAAAA
ncbi:hypothetical protein DFA_02162 [Cavenderia fasciculata]|uniref:Transmembrane protein n=1 Tax=Cavenderia fasciculata TaxID=261658 RepID=F4PYA8_CACFS|nr:uncharacterized protein DFA_02162 [Cavenderia fasciculata]EGG19375.1 hypothetical protein DFA_02162 [Cavenderia fasciculata]|eukprot:XP_004357646.1 hypothetical protein DFA_02162 [Cavenderia fasciculata]